MTLIKDIEPGAMITFRSKRADDTVVWRGTLEARGGYRFARGYGDPAAYNAAVRQVDNTVPSDPTALTYFVITVDNDATTPTQMVFAEEWIISGSLTVLLPGNKVTIQVDDPAGNTNAIIALLASAGYSTRIIS